MGDLISRSDTMKRLRNYAEQKHYNGEVELANGILKAICFIEKEENIPTAYDVDKVVAEMQEQTSHLNDCTKYGNKDAEQQAKSYSTMMMYEVADIVDDLIDIVKRGGRDE